jgi:hypothetical protein
VPVRLLVPVGVAGLSAALAGLLVVPEGLLVVPVGSRCRWGRGAGGVAVPVGWTAAVVVLAGLLAVLTVLVVVVLVTMPANVALRQWHLQSKKKPTGLLHPVGSCSGSACALAAYLEPTAFTSGRSRKDFALDCLIIAMSEIEGASFLHLAQRCPREIMNLFQTLSHLGQQCGACCCDRDADRIRA